ncbi:hypothetical protein AALA17_06220 [Lactobacillaceae bacterium 24-114]
MKKLILGFMAMGVALTLSACGSKDSQSSSSSSTTNQSSQVTAKNSSTQTATTLDADKLTPAQTACLVMYYGNNHMPGADSNNYTANMAKSGQGATVKIYDKDNVPKGEGPLYKSYPDGASVLYNVKLTNTDSDNDGHTINQIYYTIANNKFYLEDSDAGIQPDGVTASKMVAYAKEKGAEKQILNVAKNTKVVDKRGSSSSSSNSSSNSSKLSTQQLGTLVAIYQMPDWFKDGVSNGDMYYGSYDDSESGQVAGYSYVTANGDPTSWLYFKQNGNDVTIKYVDVKDGETVAEASMTTKHVTVSGLLRDYYTSQSQKDEINGYANKLKPESDFGND